MSFKRPEIAELTKAMLKNKNMMTALVVVGGFALLGGLFIVTSQAATYSVQKEAEDGTTAGNFESVSDTLASGGRYIKFGGGGVTPPSTGGPARTDPYCGGTYTGPVGGETQPVPAPASGGKTLEVGSGKQYSDIGAALDAASGGDVVSVAPGSYDGFGAKNGDGASKCITVAGNGAKITINGGLSINDSRYFRLMNMTIKDSGSYGISANGSQNVSFVNVEIDGSSNGGINIPGGKFILIDGCDVHNTNGGPGGSGEGEAISIADETTDAEVRFTKVHDSGEEGIDVKYSGDTNTKIHDNEVYGVGGPQIYIDGADGVEVYNNYVHNNIGHGADKAGIGIASETTYGNTDHVANVKVYNNVVVNNLGSGIQFYTESGGSIRDISVYNNTIMDNKMAVENDGGSNFKFYNNIYNGDLNSGDASGNFNTDPQFLSATDWHLKAGSPAIDTATGTPAPEFDKDYAPRPKGGGVDYGAYEQ